MEDSVILGEHTLPYQWKQSPRRRTVSIVVHPERGVVVHTPRRYSRSRVEAFLREKSRWVLKHITRLERERKRKAAQSWEQGAAVPYRGRHYPLRIVLDGALDAGKGGGQVGAGQDRVRLEENAIAVELPWEGCSSRDGVEDGTQGGGAQGCFSFAASPAIVGEQIKARMTDWYRQQAAEVLTRRVDHFKLLLGVEPLRIRVKQLKRRWGSCSAKGALNFNWQLILAPPDVLDYVVVHELCHLLALNHSPRFWGHVESILPDFQERRRWLRQNDFTLTL